GPKIMRGDKIRQTRIWTMIPCLPDRGCDLAPAIGSGVAHAIAKILACRAVRSDHEGGPREGSLERGQPGRLEPAWQGEDPGRCVGRGEQGITMISGRQPQHAIAACGAALL